MMSKNQSGRSLLEIIAVMAIMGIFTLGSVAAFQAGMNSVRSKYIMEQIQVRVEEIVSNTELSKGHKKMVYTPEYVNKTGEDKYGYRFKTVNATQDERSLAFKLVGAAATATTVEMEVSGNISAGVCKSLREKMIILGTVTEAKADGTDILNNPCPGDVSKITLTVKKISSSKKNNFGNVNNVGNASESIVGAKSYNPLVCKAGYCKRGNTCEICPAGTYCPEDCDC